VKRLLNLFTPVQRKDEFMNTDDLVGRGTITFFEPATGGEEVFEVTPWRIDFNSWRATCPFCGKRVKGDWNFCPFCGRSLLRA
jgi:hypothetical protein